MLSGRSKAVPELHCRFCVGIAVEQVVDIEERGDVASIAE